MALVSAAALITEQFAFVEILKTIISILERKPVFLKCFIRTVNFFTLLFQLTGTFQQKHYAGKCHHQQQTALKMPPVFKVKIYSNQSR